MSNKHLTLTTDLFLLKRYRLSNFPSQILTKSFIFRYTISKSIENFPLNIQELMMLKPLAFFTALILFSSIAFPQNQPLLLYPSINKDGSRIAFSYQGDIWTVSSSGGKADRITEHEGIETNKCVEPGRK